MREREIDMAVLKANRFGQVTRLRVRDQRGYTCGMVDFAARAAPKPSQHRGPTRRVHRSRFSGRAKPSNVAHASIRTGRFSAQKRVR